MKKRRSVYLKIVLAAFIIILMSAACIGISAEGDSSAELKIAYCNLSFESDTHIMYAIKSDNANVKLLVWSEAQSEYLLGSETAAVAPLDSQMNINGAPYTVFKYTGLAAKQMTDDVYVRACIDNGNGDVTYGEVHKYSILQYAYNKLGKTGTATTNEKLIKMLENMLAYGASAQEYHGYKTDRLATAEFVQVKLDDGSLPDGFKSGLYLEGEKITITAPMQNTDGVAFSHWEDELGNIIGSPTSDYTLTVGQENIKYIPNYINCSTGLKLTSNGDGTCYVAGIGSCTDTDLVIPYVSPDGDVVTKIGDHAFSGYIPFTSVIIPDSVTNIDDYAFYDCSNLESITIPEGVAIIGGRAFGRCPSLKNMTIPDSVTNIGGSAFSDCSSLKNITIPEGVTNIGGAAFSNCSSLESITLPFVGATKDGTSNTNFGYIFGTSYYSGHSSCVPASLKTVIITGGTSIDNNAFAECSNIKSITIPDSVTSIGNSAFSRCSGITNLIIPGNVTSIGNSAFSGCSGITNLIIPDSVTSIGSNAFSRCSGITRLTIGSTVTDIGNDAFSYCGSLTEINFNAVAMSDLSRNNFVFRESGQSGDGITINIGKNVTKIPAYLFCPYNNGDLDTITSVFFDENSQCTSIGDRAFGRCSSLKNITIPDSVTNIGSATFFYCSNLESITIPDSVTSIGNSAFDGCSGITRLTIGKGLTNIGDSAFKVHPNLESIIVSAENTAYKAIGNCLIENSTKILILGCNNSIIPMDGSVTGIAEYAFYKCSSIISITIPDSVTSIGKYAFYDCSSLESVIFNDLPKSWTLKKNPDDNYGIVKDVRVPSDNATNLKSKFYDYYWYK